MKHPPIRRHESLQPFSRDHYQGLVQAQHLQKVAEYAPNDRREALGAFLQAWRSEMAEHFVDEERLLIPLMREEDVNRLRREHAMLRAMALEAPERQRDPEPDPAWLTRLGQTLNDHIRWEERELFPAIEAAATDEQLAKLKQQTDQIEAHRPRSLAH